MGVDRKDYDIRLHEPLRSLERDGNRSGVSGYRLELLPDLLDADGGWDRTRARRSRQCEVWRFIPGKPRVVTLVDLAYSLRDLSRQLRENEDSIQLQALLAVIVPGLRIGTKT